MTGVNHMVFNTSVRTGVILYENFFTVKIKFSTNDKRDASIVHMLRPFPRKYHNKERPALPTESFSPGRARWEEGCRVGVREGGRGAQDMEGDAGSSAIYRRRCYRTRAPFESYRGSPQATSAFVSRCRLGSFGSFGLLKIRCWKKCVFVHHE